MALTPHHRHNGPRQGVPAKEIGFKLCPQNICRYIFYGTGLRISAIVEQRIQRAAGCRQNRFKAGVNGSLVGIIQKQSFKALSVQYGNVICFSRGCKNPPTFGLQGLGTMLPDAG